MKIVRLDNGTVAEIIPQYATPVEKWYGAAFAALCAEAPDGVEAGWTRNADGTWSAPAAPAETAEPEEPTTEADMLETILDHEARLSALELVGGGEG